MNPLKNIGVEIIELNKWDQYLRGMWDYHFATGLSASEKMIIYMDQFLWHLFSYKKIECLKKIEAKTASNNLNKQTCYIFYQNQSRTFILENPMHVKAEHFEQENDIYIVDKEFNWTYVQTHEEQCGPYFYIKQ
ncbi:DUF4275 family protein [Cohnella silvisoli]|uniref:DUF4275 family protein n=1 Tax=Cohnella silvisoli TaxID=2873699 RepID=A0ABV1L0J8_9BACL|nr:DUF4275 family protein [Cohnella silvisoli]MCD9025053.1 DUF4275 family protein [Cohnella silvisoli]